MKFSTKSVLLLSNLVLAVTAQQTKITNLSEVQKKIEEMKGNRNLQGKGINQKRNLPGYNIFSFNSYLETIKYEAGISDTCMAAFREINFFQTEYDLHDPLNQVGDSLVAFEEALFQEYPVPIGQIAVGDSAAKKQCRDNGGQYATLNGTFYADSYITEALLRLGVQGIIGRPGLLGNYQAVIALAIGYAALAEEGPIVLFIIGLILFSIIGSGLSSIEGCVETYNYTDRFVCVPKDESACTDEEIVRMHAVSDSTYYLIHGFDTLLQSITSAAIAYFVAPFPADEGSDVKELTLRTDLLESLPSPDGEGMCSQSVTISNRGKSTKASKAPKGTKSPKA
ncbi:predicted protein [Chaetoceros tenuissimus]|uniref:Uncharacterized protein n=1 Tax=Chaetoceros tenuissimus TaxID=426638 RepID=A0AAD3CFY1_9STRA|nr:predicted protein [Chaetoceros tenuissimus]